MAFIARRSECKRDFATVTFSGLYSSTYAVSKVATSSICDGVSLATVPPLRCWTDQKKHVLARVFLSKGRIPSICAYSGVAHDHLPFGWARSNSRCRPSRISDTRFEGSQRHGRNAARPTLGFGSASILSGRLPPSPESLKCTLAVVNHCALKTHFRCGARGETTSLPGQSATLAAVSGSGSALIPGQSLIPVVQW